LLEWCDVVGSLRYAQGRKDLSAMATGLYSRCMGGNSTIIAMAEWPDEFTHIEALVLLNVVSDRPLKATIGRDQTFDFRSPSPVRFWDEEHPIDRVARPAAPAVDASPHRRSLAASTFVT